MPSPPLAYKMLFTDVSIGGQVETGGMHVPQLSEDNVQELVLSFHCESPKDRAQTIQVGCKSLYPQSLVPCFALFWYLFHKVAQAGNGLTLQATVRKDLLASTPLPLT